MEIIFFIINCNLTLCFILYTLNYFQESGPKKELNVNGHGNKLMGWVPLCLSPGRCFFSASPSD